MRISAVIAALVAASTGLGGLVAAPARAADFDLSTLCPSAKPAPAELGTALDAVIDGTAAAATSAGGVLTRYESDNGQMIYRYDVATSRARRDRQGYGWGDHWTVDATTYYEGHKKPDGADVKAALTVLDQNQAWDVTTRPSAVPGTPEAMARFAPENASLLYSLKWSTGHTVKGEKFTCSVVDDELHVTDTYDPSYVPGTKLAHDSYVFRLDPATGALQNETAASTGADPWNASNLWSYGPLTIGLPAVTLVSYATWRSAYVKGSFYVLSHDAAKKARAAAKKVKSHSAKVKAVVKANSKVAADYEVTKLKKTSEKHGVLTKANRYKSTKTWWYRLKVSGSKVVLTTNVKL